MTFLGHSDADLGSKLGMRYLLPQLRYLYTRLLSVVDFRGDPGERAERLPLLLRLWMADAQGRLGKVLEDATTFETSYEERLERNANRPV